METQELLPLEDVPEVPRIGRDELNLTEFPFFILNSKGVKNPPLVLRFKDGDKEWMVSGHAVHGLPTAADGDVYVILMELSKEQGFPDRIHFSRYDLLRRLGWDTSASSYNRLVLALQRLQGITISTKNAFWDARKRRWDRERAIGIIAEFDITGSRDAGAEEPPLFPCWFTWSPELYRNMQAGFLKALDVRLFLSLESAISKQLYRYLDRKRGGDGKVVFRIALKTLAWEKLGLSRNYYPSQIRRKLDLAHRELLRVGFILSAEYAPMQTLPGEEQVIYRFPPRLPRDEGPAELKALPEALSPLAQRLVGAGVSRQTAQDLAEMDPEACEWQLAYLPYREARDPGAVLVKSIREGWSAPPAWTQAQEEKQKAAREEQRRVQAAAKVRTNTVLESEFDAYWASLTVQQREEIEAAAASTLRKENRVLAEFASKHPDSPMYRGALRPYLKQLSGWKPSEVGR